MIDNYAPNTIGGRTAPPFPRDPFGTVRKDPSDRERYAVRVTRDGRLRWWVLCLVIPHDPVDLRAENLHEWPVIYSPEPKR